MGSSRDQALGSQMGFIESILQNTHPSGASRFDLGSYQSPMSSFEQLKSMLQGNQSRDLGLAGRQGGAQAAAYGYNPSSSIQRAQSGVYGNYAQQFAQLPQLESMIRSQNFAPLLALLQMKGGLAGQRADEGAGWGSLVGGLGSAAIKKWG
jgi:hypothetical protein